MTDVNLKIRHAKRQNAQNLDLKDFNLESIPIEVYSLKTLLYLNLSNNKLSTIDKAIENLKILTELNLNNNAITTLPIELTTLPNLKIVKIEQNPIYDKLEDFNYNWKESLKNFLNGPTDNTNSVLNETNIDKIKQILDSSNNTEDLNNKKPSFDLTSSKFNFNNTLGNFNMKNIVKEIPKCNIFDNKDSVKFLSNLNNSRIRIQSGNINKKITSFNEPVQSIYKNESTSDTLKINEEAISTNDKAELDLMKQKIESLEKEIKNLHTISTEKEEESKNTIRLLQVELKSLKLKGETIENVITNKRNWMSDTSTIVNSNNIINNRPVFNEDNDNKIKELESQLQKETQNCKRLRNEVERLSLQLNSVKNISTNSEEIQKSKFF
jgi:hypothetical protein